MTEYFKEIEDTRQQGKIKYELLEVIVITIIAVTAGAEHWNEIAMYCKGKVEMFRERYGLRLKNGTPTDDTFQRIFAIIKPEQLEKCFVNWAKSVCEMQENEIVSVDGKTLRGSRYDDYSVIHMVSAWAGKSGIVLGQQRVNEKSNEITAVPELLDLIDVENCIITSDAMSCQKNTVKKIREKNCDYVRLYFETALSDPQLYSFVRTKPKTEKAHGRIETRQYFLSSEIHDFVNTDEWKGLAAIGMVKTKRIVDCMESVEYRYFITSLTDLDKFSQAVRMHWGIENNLHWCLDTNFNEDKCRMRMDNSGENLAVIRHIALNLYKSYSKVKLSMKSKRFRCSFDDDFLCSVILNKFFCFFHAVALGSKPICVYLREKM